MLIAIFCRRDCYSPPFHALPLTCINPRCYCPAYGAIFGGRGHVYTVNYNILLGQSMQPLPCAAYAGYIVYADGAAVWAMLSRFAPRGALSMPIWYTTF